MNKPSAALEHSDNRRGAARDGRVRYLAAPAPKAEDEISLLQFLAIIWRGIWLIVLSLAVFVALGFYRLKMATPAYTVKMVVAPVTEGTPNILTQLRNLAPLTGLQIGRSNENLSNLDRYIEYIGTAKLASRLQEKYGLMQRVFDDQWDALSETWVPSPETGFVSKLRARVRDFVGLPLWAPPNVQHLAAHLGKLINVEAIGTTPLRTISLEHPDPAFAVWLLTIIHEEIETIIKEESRRQTEIAIDFAVERLAQVTVVDHRQALVLLLSDLEKKLMLSRINLPFAASVFDLPTQSPMPTSPRIVWTIALMVIAGLVVGVLLASLLHSLRQYRDSRRIQRIPKRQ